MANLFRKRRPAFHTSRPRARQSLTASGERVTAKRAHEAARINSSWQRRSFMYYDALGEIKYAAAFYARLSKLELYVGEWTVDANGERSLQPTKNERARAALDRIRDPGGSGSRSGLLGSYGRIKFLAGEGYLFFTKDDDGIEKWEFLSTSEIRLNPLGTDGGRASYQRVRAPSLAPEEYRDPGEDEWDDVQAQEAIAYRFWRRHPQYSEWPDSPMKGVLDVCEELLIADREVRANSLSRLAGNGILFLDDRISELPPQPLEGADPDDDVASDPWLDDLTAAMLEPMQDEGAAERVVPLVTRVTVPLEPGLKLQDCIHHLRLVDASQLDAARGKRLEAIQRIALGLEMPAEVLTGLSNANHWTAWEISDDAWEHLEPFAQELVDDLTSGYLLPTLKADGLPDWDNFSVMYDEARLRTEPEKSKDAKDLHKEGVLSDEALRTATGFTEDDAPSEEERRVWLSVYSRDPGFALGDDPRGSVGEPSARITESESPAAGAPALDGGETTGTPAGSQQEVQKGPPQQGKAPQEPPVTSSALLEAHVLGACSVALTRARKVASNRVLSRAKAHPDALSVLRAAPLEHGPAVLGPDATRQLGIQDRDLVAGGAAEILAGPLALLLGADRTTLLVQAIEQHAALTLYDAAARPFPPPLLAYISSVVRDHPGDQPATRNGVLEAVGA